MDHFVSFFEKYAPYVVGFFAALWAFIVWTFNSILRRFNFATTAYVDERLAKCHLELTQKIEKVETNVDSNRVLNTQEHNEIRDLFIKYFTGRNL